MNPISSEKLYRISANQPRYTIFAKLTPFIDKSSGLVFLAATILIVLEGSIRKWIIGSQGGLLSYLIYFSKDILFASLLLLPKQRDSSAPLQAFYKWFCAGSILLIIGIIISCMLGVNLSGAVLTLRATIFLPMIALLAARRIKGISLRLFACVLSILTISNFALGIIQNSLPTDHVLNRYADEGIEIVALESGVRAVGTFAYITGMGVISIVGIWAGIVLLSLEGKFLQRMVGCVAIVSGFGCGLTSVSRGPIAVGIIMVLAWALFSKAAISRALIIIAAAAMVTVLAFFFGIAPTFSRLVDNLRERHETAGDSYEDRAFGQIEEMLVAINIAPLGNGLGTEQVGGNYYVKAGMGFTTFESQMPRIVMEVGLLGLI